MNRPRPLSGFCGISIREHSIRSGLSAHAHVRSLSRALIRVQIRVRIIRIKTVNPGNSVEPGQQPSRNRLQGR